MATGDPVRILVVDDHPLVREGLSQRISGQSDLTICGEAATPEEALAFLRTSGADLAIIDLRLQGGHGLELIKRIRAEHPTVKMLVLSAFQESLYAERCLRAGARGYLNKQESSEKIIEAIRSVLAGERYMSPELSKRLIGQALDEYGADSPVQRLSDRELQVLRMIGEGLSTGEIAEQLSLSAHTIDTHRENLKRKLGLRTAAELTSFAVRWHLESM